MFVPSLEIVTAAPGMTEPVASFTSPVMVPNVVWATAAPGPITLAKNKRRKLVRFADFTKGAQNSEYMMFSSQKNDFVKMQIDVVE
jgi:hypothetical protein